MKRVILFFCVLVFSIFSNTNNLSAKEIENNIKENISNEIEKLNLTIKKLTFLILQQKIFLFNEKTYFGYCRLIFFINIRIIKTIFIKLCLIVKIELEK